MRPLAFTVVNNWRGGYLQISSLCSLFSFLRWDASERKRATSAAANWQPSTNIMMVAKTTLTMVVVVASTMALMEWIRVSDFNEDDGIVVNDFELLFWKCKLTAHPLSLCAHIRFQHLSAQSRVRWLSLMSDPSLEWPIIVSVSSRPTARLVAATLLHSSPIWKNLPCLFRSVLWSCSPDLKTFCNPQECRHGEKCL